MNQLLYLLILLLGYTLLDYFRVIGPRPYPGVFSIPGYPIVGNLFQVLNNPAKRYMEWVKKYNTPIFQIRLGNKRVIVVNSFKDVNEIWKKSAVNSRPTQYTFHHLISSTKGFTVGTTPFSATFKKRKQVVSSALNSKSVESEKVMLSREVCHTIRRIYEYNPKIDCQPSTNPHRTFEDINLLKHFQYFTLRTAVYITYGIKLHCYSSDKELADTIIENENQIIKYRSPTTNLADFFPIFRIFKPKKVDKTKLIRDDYMTVLMNRHLDSSSVPCLVRDYYEIANNKKINYEELQSICLTMISAGLDNTPLNLNHLLGVLSVTPRLQQKVIDQLCDLYANPVNMWAEVGKTMDCTFVIALLQETLRHLTVLPLGLPRVTTKEIEYKGIIIPENTTLFMNAYGANHDPTEYNNPMEFDPYRWFENRDPTKNLLDDKILSHLSFGKGVRKCSGNIIAFKEMYVMICRLLICFKITKPRDDKFTMEMDPFKNNNNPQATSFDPKLFKYQLKPRVLNGNDRLYNLLHQLNQWDQ